MAEIKLRFGEREFVLGPGVTTLGRTPDNAISFPDDSNVSRYHAEIESRGDEYCLIDLGSSNGTTVNGQKAGGETYLRDGDRIVLGGSSEIAVEFVKPESDTPVESAAAHDFAGELPRAAEIPSIHSIPDAPTSAGSNSMLLIAGGICGLAVVVVIAAGVIYYMSSGSSCEARASIVKPEPGDTIVEATEIEIDIQNAECVQRAVFTIDGVEFATADTAPFNASIDPKEFPDLADGFDHALAVELIDEDDNRIAPQLPVLLAFETREISKRPANTEIAQTNTQQTPPPVKGKEVSLIEVQEMSKRLVKQFSGNFAYNVSNRQFLQEVQKKTAEYAQDGYFDRASRYRDAINVAYVREQNLDAALGFMLAMSRSKFSADKQGQDEGLFRMSNAFVTSNGYNGLCGAETLSDPAQNCAAKASALYMKAIVFGVFDGDVIYSAAAFGKSPQDAGVWKATLPKIRSDVWNSIKTPQEREQVVRFFAAGIVAENPQKFGLKKDKPLSELYRLTM